MYMQPKTVVSCLLVMASVLLAAEPKDKFDEYLQSAGPTYRNCGTVRVDGKNRVQVDDCVLKSFAEGKSFVVRYDLQGIDSTVAQGLWFNGKQLTVALFDDYACTTPYCTHPESCSQPRITKTKDGLHVRCTNDYDF